MKKFITYLFFSLLLIIPYTVHAKEEAAYFSGPKELKPGDEAIIYLGFQASDIIESVQYQIDAASLEIASMDSVNGATISKIGESVSQSSKGLKPGIVWAKIMIKVPMDAEIDSQGEITVHNIGITLKGQSSTIYASNVSYQVSIKETVEPKISEDIIDSFSIKNVEDFTFDQDIKKYNLSVSHEVTSLDFDILLNGEGSSYIIENNDLVVGKNAVSVQILDESGLETTYEFEVIREENEKPVICEECEACNENIWIIISSILGVLIIMETIYIFYLKKEQ